MINGILGTSKKNPILFIQPHPEDKNLSIINYGLERFITFPNNPESIQYKIIVGMLSASGIIKKQIQDTFQIDYKTIVKYENAYKSGEEKRFIELMKFPGRSVYKMNDEIENFIVVRFFELKKKDEIKYNKIIKEEVKNKFNIELSREKVRQIYNNKNNRKRDTVTQQQKTKKEMEIQKPMELEIKEIKLPQRYEIDNQYAGVLILNIWIRIFFNKFPDENEGKYLIKEIFIHWMYGILLGRQNLEGFRHFIMNDICLISGLWKELSVESQRIILRNLSIREYTRSVGHLLKVNIKHYTVRSNDYYIDGTFKEYTGERKILKG